MEYSNSLPANEELSSLLKSISTIISHIDTFRERLNVNLADNFSVFDILRIANDEKSISLAIAHLLNPKGSHAQGGRFLHAFLDILSEELSNVELIKKFKDSLKDRTAVVKTEDVILNSRRIDITVRLSSALKFGIENKLDAGDQPNQVKDYLKALPTEGFLLYLSKEADRMPSEDSIPKNEREEAERSGRLFHINYDNHIFKWIERCRQISQAEKIRWYLGEIQQLINRFFYGRDTFMENNKDLLSIMTADRQNLRAVLYIKNNYEAVADDILSYYFNHLKQQAETRLKKFPDWSVSKGKEPRNPYYQPLFITPKDGLFKEKISVCMEFQATPYRKTIYGIIADKNLGALREKIEQKAKELPKGSSSVGWAYYKFYDVQDYTENNILLDICDMRNGRESPELKEKTDKLLDNIMILVEFLDNLFNERASS
jgi:hypothetical protein